MCFISALFSCHAALLLLMFIFSTVVLSTVVTCALVSGRLPLGAKGSLLCPVIQECDTKKSNHMIRQKLMVSESSFCPDTAWVCVAVWVGGGNLFTAHTRCFESSRQRKKDSAPELNSNGEFSGIKILPVSSLQLSTETRGTTAFRLWSITIFCNQPSVLK